MEFDKQVRTSFVNSPGVKNQFLNDMATRVPQAYSGVFN